MTKMYKLLFLSLVFSSTLVSISSYSWLGMWLGLEMNLLSIMPLMQNSKSILSSESAIKYFIVQAIASTIVMVSIICLMTKTQLTSQASIQSTFFLMINSALMTKMGIAPFHFWLPEVLEGLDWMTCLLVLTWQKIAPMVLLMYNMSFNLFTTTVIVSSMVVSGVMGVNQISTRKIMAYSSINHMGWMLSSMMIMETIWLFYFIIYATITINLAMMMNKYKIFFMNQLHQSMNENPMAKLWFTVNFLSLSGIPPFLGFLPKWITVQALVSNGAIILPVTMIILTLLTVFMYIRITLSSVVMNVSEQKWTKINTFFNSTLMSMINFVSISSLIFITIAFNMT
uniref:NADH-ubiquinone oxidoreductase chain 2 n=1 Tax=Pyrearinus termitilluminans TaxID=109589 RepID=A0A161UHD3_9COLE|nr:NADH dehydrogenase subunit 2 [Pyrearinus termitilluminans]AIQ80122.1 NADH dehydrogenase subunit 2 [Pyrearinus termitilluminans]